MTDYLIYYLIRVKAMLVCIFSASVRWLSASVLDLSFLVVCVAVKDVVVPGICSVWVISEFSAGMEPVEKSTLFGLLESVAVTTSLWVVSKISAETESVKNLAVFGRLVSACVVAVSCCCIEFRWLVVSEFSANTEPVKNFALLGRLVFVFEVSSKNGLVLGICCVTISLTWAVSSKFSVVSDLVKKSTLFGGLVPRKSGPPVNLALPVDVLTGLVLLLLTVVVFTNTLGLVRAMSLNPNRRKSLVL